MRKMNLFLYKIKFTVNECLTYQQSKMCIIFFNYYKYQNLSTGA